MSFQNQEVSIYYDPLLAKLIAWAPRRDLSLRRMEVALSQFLVLGVVTNIPLLRTVVAHPQFQRGEYDTGFLEENPAVVRPTIPDESRMMARALAAWAARQPVGQVATTVGSDGKASANPWESAGEQRLP